MTKIIRIRDFEVDVDKIPADVIEQKCNLQSADRRRQWIKDFDSEYNFLVLLFHLVFIEKLGESEIHQLLGYQNAANIHHLLYGLGWNYSPDYDENNRLFQENLKKLETDLADAKRNAPLLDENINEHIKLKLALEKAAHLKESSYIKLGFTSGEECARIFYYLTHVIHGYGLSPKELLHLFSFSSLSTVQDHLRNLGLNKTRKKGLEGKSQRKSQDYGETRRSGQRTRRKAQYENFAPTSSSNEEYFRRQLSDFIYLYIDPIKYEIIVGVNNTGIVNPYEVDIPITIYKPEKNSIIRFAIEYKDPKMHDPQKDAVRKELLIEKGWNYLEVIDIPEYSNNRESLDRKIGEVCDYIKNKVKAMEGN
jgi:hypothetical protein